MHRKLHNTRNLCSLICCSRSKNSTHKSLEMPASLWGRSRPLASFTEMRISLHHHKTSTSEQFNTCYFYNSAPSFTVNSYSKFSLKNTLSSTPVQQTHRPVISHHTTGNLYCCWQPPEFTWNRDMLNIQKDGTFFPHCIQAKGPSPKSEIMITALHSFQTNPLTTSHEQSLKLLTVNTSLLSLELGSWGAFPSSYYQPEKDAIESSLFYVFVVLVLKNPWDMVASKKPVSIIT